MPLIQQEDSGSVFMIVDVGRDLPMQEVPMHSVLGLQFRSTSNRLMLNHVPTRVAYLHHQVSRLQGRPSYHQLLQLQS